MAFKTNIQNPLCRTIDLTETNWEYEAPQFFDFSRVNDEEIEEFDYFSRFCVQVVHISVNSYNFKIL